MNTDELIRRVRTIEIKSRGLSHQLFAGQYHSAFKGRGMSFAEVRDYQIGDDVRDIDWNVTARFNHPYVKVFEEERELTVMLMVDVSGSQDFGSRKQSKHDLAIETAATIALSAIQNNDKIGAILFSDRIEKYIPPKKGSKHALLLIRELLTTGRQSKKTDLNIPTEFLCGVIKRRCTAFLISDFATGFNYEKNLQMAANKHDLIAIQTYDDMARVLPNVGLLQIEDAETGQQIIIDTQSETVRKAYERQWEQHQTRMEQLLRKNKVDLASVSTSGDYVKALQQLFDRRIH